ncbi:hypothetical protein OsJ_01421 [Oryza sativa Japonica Group]|uniref:Uncharacterized protein n=1 Tax=Oryza sativa subsp. japonica TaxID=39947 RepID=A2ZS59_ORYSJ|nr:hypothetical protein OsJ_01421 [Oryza sativa Japonica Group]
MATTTRSSSVPSQRAAQQAADDPGGTAEYIMLMGIQPSTFSNLVAGQCHGGAASATSMTRRCQCPASARHFRYQPPACL